MERLTAARAILYRGRMYEPGEPLPGDDARMVAAWLEAGSARITGGETTEEAAETAQEGQDGQEGQEPTNTGNDAQGGGELPAEGENDQNNQDTAGGEAAKTVEGHLDVKQLQRMTTANLEKMAADMGVDISQAKSNKERAALIAAASVQVPAEDNGGGSQ